MELEAKNGKAGPKVWRHHGGRDFGYCHVTGAFGLSIDLYLDSSSTSKLFFSSYVFLIKITQFPGILKVKRLKD